MELLETDLLRSLGQPVDIKEIKLGVEIPSLMKKIFKQFGFKRHSHLLNSLTYRSQIPFRKIFVEPYIPVMMRWTLT